MIVSENDLLLLLLLFKNYFNLICMQRAMTGMRSMAAMFWVLLCPNHSAMSPASPQPRDLVTSTATRMTDMCVTNPVLKNLSSVSELELEKLRNNPRRESMLVSHDIGR